jgi:hypothetical protein
MRRMATPTARTEIAATAARLVVEEGMEYGPAKRRAIKLLDLPQRSELPNNDEIEDEVFSYLQLFCADTQPQELRILRELALVWMRRLAEFRPHLTGAVWRGTATRLSDIHLNLYCDDSKSAEIDLINKHVDYDVGSRPGPRGEDVDVLTVSVPCAKLSVHVLVHLSILDADDQRIGHRADRKGRTERGDIAALQRLLQEEDAPSGPRQ